MLLKRYGITSKRFIRNLEDMVSLLKEHGVVGTFPTTATVLARHVEIIRVLEGMEIAVHGLNHVDLAARTRDEQEVSISEAVRVFREHGINPAGFRAPYLRCSDSLLDVVAATGFLYDSSIAVGWSSSGRLDSILGMKETLASYGIIQVGTHSPSLRMKLAELPVAVPDDEILIDRLRLDSTTPISEAFGAMIESAAGSHGHLVLQLHPERFHIFRGALVEAIRHARERGAWVAPLKDVAKWWVARHDDERKWPDRSTFALTISGDIDAVTLGDFLGRRIGR